MTRMSADARREKLVDAAITVMTRDGVARATTRAIAAEAGMPLGVFHYAFRSKAELMSLAIKRIARQSKIHIDEAVLSGSVDVRLEVVRAGLFAYFDHVIAHPQAHLVTYELTTTALRDSDLDGLAKDQYDYYLAENEALLLAAAEALGMEYVVPVSVVSRYTFSVMDGLALNYLARGEREEACEVVELTARTLLDMVRPQGAGQEGTA